jgi:uncharacterized membrane protein
LLPLLDPSGLQLGAVSAALIGALAYGTGDFLGGRAALRLSASGAVAIAQTVAMLFMIQQFQREGAALPTGGDWYPSLLGGVAYAFGLLLLYQGLAFGRIGIVAPLCGLVGIVIPLLGDIVLERAISQSQLLGIGLCALAAILIAWLPPALEEGGPVAWSVKVGVMSGLGYGTADLCLGSMTPETATGALLVTRSVAALIAVSVVLLLVMPGRTVRLAAMAETTAIGPDGSIAGWWPKARLLQQGCLLAAIAGVLDTIGHMGYVNAAVQGSMGVAAAIVALFPAVSVLLAVIILKERISRLQATGFALGIAAIWVVSL